LKSVGNILGINQYHPYKITLVQELSDEDFDRRLEFCETIMRKFDENQNVFNQIVFSDEATFMLNGMGQDGAPTHFGGHVRAHLDEVFPNRRIGRRGAIEWPPRSPDLTTLDSANQNMSLKHDQSIRKKHNLNSLPYCGSPCIFLNVT